MTSQITKIDEYLTRSLRGENLTEDETLEAMTLLAEKGANLAKYTAELPKHTKHNYNAILNMPPEKRCSIFLDGMSYGALHANNNPTYEIIRRCLPRIPERLREPWYAAFEEHKQELRTQQQ